MAASYTAYTDESGNTGLAVFDKNQPYYRTTTLLTAEDIEVSGKTVIEECHQILGVDELHGSDIKLRAIEQVADTLYRFLEPRDVRFAIVQIDKRHVVALKFANWVLDSQNNMAVDDIHYSSKFHNFALSGFIEHLLTDADLERFWMLGRRADAEEFSILCREVLGRARTFEKVDKRLRQLTVEALEWAADHSDKLVVDRLSPLDSPNIVGINHALVCLREFAEEQDFRITRFIHDEQQEFGRRFEEMFKILSKHKFENHWFMPSTVALTDRFECNFEMASSKDNVGLQITDVMMYLLAKVQDVKAGSASDRLIEIVNRSFRFLEFSAYQLNADLKTMADEARSKPLSEEELKLMKAVRDKFDAVRHQRMKKQ